MIPLCAPGEWSGRDCYNTIRILKRRAQGSLGHELRFRIENLTEEIESMGHRDRRELGDRRENLIAELLLSHSFLPAYPLRL
jgi:hypothetical protein